MTRVTAVVLAVWAVGCAAAPLGAIEIGEYDRWNEKYEENVKEQKGIRFKVPKDYPIKQYEGYIAPIPFEHYAYIKFEKANARIESLEKRVTEIEERLEAERSKRTAQAAGGA